eukprot:11917916-Heterocapsa_arctica.AAC.1
MKFLKVALVPQSTEGQPRTAEGLVPRRCVSQPARASQGWLKVRGPAKAAGGLVPRRCVGQPRAAGGLVPRRCEGQPRMAEGLAPPEEGTKRKV